MPYYNTQYRILHGRELARRVVRKLQLQDVPEFNGTRAADEHAACLAAHDAAAPGGAGAAGSRQALEPPKADETSDESALVSAFLSRVRVVPVPDSRLVDVFFQGQNASVRGEAANTLVDEYVAQNLEVKLQSTQNMLEWLEREVATQQAKVEQSERELADYRDRENAMSLDDKNNIVLSRLNALNDAVLRARTTRIEKEAIYKQVKTIERRRRRSIPVIAQNPQIQPAQAAAGRAAAREGAA